MGKWAILTVNLHIPASCDATKFKAPFFTTKTLRSLSQKSDCYLLFHHSDHLDPQLFRFLFLKMKETSTLLYRSMQASISTTDSSGISVVKALGPTCMKFWTTAELNHLFWNLDMPKAQHHAKVVAFWRHHMACLRLRLVFLLFVFPVFESAPPGCFDPRFFMPPLKDIRRQFGRVYPGKMRRCLPCCCVGWVALKWDYVIFWLAGDCWCCGRDDPSSSASMQLSPGLCQ